MTNTINNEEQTLSIDTGVLTHADASSAEAGPHRAFFENIAASMNEATLVGGPVLNGVTLPFTIYSEFFADNNGVYGRGLTIDSTNGDDFFAGPETRQRIEDALVKLAVEQGVLAKVVTSTTTTLSNCATTVITGRIDQFETVFIDDVLGS